MKCIAFLSHSKRHRMSRNASLMSATSLSKKGRQYGSKFSSEPILYCHLSDKSCQVHVDYIWKTDKSYTALIDVGVVAFLFLHQTKISDAQLIGFFSYLIKN